MMKGVSRRAHLLGTLLAGSLAAASCHRVFPYSPALSDGPRAEWSVDERTTSETAHRDGRPRDTSRGDGPNPADTAAQDLGGSDTLQSDSSTPTGPCTLPGTLDLQVSPQLAFCSKPAPWPMSQCNAVTSCNLAAGWSLCRASVYKTLYANQAPPRADAWLAGCVRDGGDITFAPTDQPCSDCAPMPTGANLTNGWECGGSHQSWSGGISAYVGVLTYSSCKRVGINDPSTAAYWWPVPASNAAGGAFAACCHL
jgi:hypothetical protein